MWLKELYERWIGRPPTVRRARPQGPRRHSLRLSLEQLEDRTVPSSGTSFLTPVYYPVAGLPIAVAVGDFNNDHIPDLVTANLVNSIGGAGVSVLLANGDGTFHTAINYSVGGAAQSVAVGDFNGDGNLDVVVANQGDSSGNQV